MTYTGKIIYISDIEVVGINKIQKRTIVLEEASDNNYKGSIAFDIIKDRINLIDGFNIGDTVEAFLNIKANESKGKYYTNITAWKIIEFKEGLFSHSFPEDSLDLPF